MDRDSRGQLTMKDRIDEIATPLRIAVVAPLHESVPPKLYGGTERVVSYLTEELVRLGMDVTLFATGDSVTSARLRAVAPHGLRLGPGFHDPNPLYFALIPHLMESPGVFLA